MENTNKKATLASRIYANIAAKHPDWSQKRIYNATRWALENRKPVEAVEAVAEVPAEA